MTEQKFKFRYYRGVRYVAANNPAPTKFATCGTCKRSWNDSKSTGFTPTPSGRCPFEYFRGHSSH